MSGNRKRGKEISRRRRTIRRGRAVTKIAPTDFVHATNIRKKGYRSRKGMERRERDAIDRSLARRKDDASSRQLAFSPDPFERVTSGFFDRNSFVVARYPFNFFSLARNSTVSFTSTRFNYNKFSKLSSLVINLRNSREEITSGFFDRKSLSTIYYSIFFTYS